MGGATLAWSSIIYFTQDPFDRSFKPIREHFRAAFDLFPQSTYSYPSVIHHLFRIGKWIFVGKPDENVIELILNKQILNIDVIQERKDIINSTT